MTSATGTNTGLPDPSAVMRWDPAGVWRTAMNAASEARGCIAGASRYVLELLQGRLVEVPVELLCDEYGFSLADSGWHYFRALLADYQRQPQVPLERTTFYRFFRHPVLREVRDVNDVLFLHDPARRYRAGAFRFHFNTYPWGEWARCGAVRGGRPFGRYYDQVSGQDTRDRYGYRGNIWYEPGDVHALRKEWRHVTQMYESVRRGYRPWRHGSLPRVVLLLRRDGARRFVRHNGHHRLAALSHLGHQRVTALIARNSVGIVREEDVKSWYYVKRGLCSEGNALEIFHAFFELNGRERRRYLGLPAAY